MAAWMLHVRVSPLVPLLSNYLSIVEAQRGRIRLSQRAIVRQRHL